MDSETTRGQSSVDWKRIRAILFGMMAALAAMVLGIAGLAKLLWPAPLLPIERLGELPRPLVVLVALSEIAIAWWLIRGCFAAIARWTVALLFAGYLALLVWAASRGVDSCRCLGRIGVPIDVMMLVDATIFVGFLLGRPRTERQRPNLLEVAVVSCLLLGLAVVGSSTPSEGPVPVVTGSTLGRGFGVNWDSMLPGTPIDSYPVFASTRPREPLDEGKWVLCFSRSHCGKCQAVLPRFAALAGRHTAWRFAVVETSRDSSQDAPPTHSARLPAFELADHEVYGRVTWIVRVPMFVVLEDGKLVAVCESLESLERTIDQGR